MNLGVTHFRGDRVLRQLSGDELLAEFPCLSWSEREWVDAMTADDSRMVDALAARFEYLNTHQSQRGKHSNSHRSRKAA